MKNNYSFIDLFYLFYCIIRTKIISKRARLIRFPIDIRGCKFIDWGHKLTTGKYCRVETFSEKSEKVLFFGKSVQLNDFVHITAMKQVRIGDNVLMASKIYISDCSHGSYKGDKMDSHPDISPIDRPYYIKDVFIGDNVWIGEGVSILPGSIIGKGCIIGANSLVNSEIPPYSIAVGIPAKVIKVYDFKSRKWIKTF